MPMGELINELEENLPKLRKNGKTQKETSLFFALTEHTEVTKDLETETKSCTTCTDR